MRRLVVVVSLFAAGGRGEVPKWGPFFDSLGKKTFAFYDRPAARLSADDQAKLGRYSINQPTAYAGLEDLLVAEIPVAVQRVFLQTVMAQPDCPPNLPTDFAALGDDDAKALVHSVLCQRKGDGYSAMLIEHCSSKDQLLPTIVAFLARLFLAAVFALAPDALAVETSAGSVKWGAIAATCGAATSASRRHGAHLQS